MTEPEGQLTPYDSEAETHLVAPGESSPALEVDPPVFDEGRYVLKEQLGRGGMGVVHRAFDSELGRHVALKLIHETVASQQNLARFLEEARVTAQLEHPAIIPIYDLGRTQQGQLYYTMRLVKGRTLAELIVDEEAAFWGETPRSDASWSFFKLLQVFVTVCRAVAYAHGRGVLHRDIKPSNIMVGPFGGVYVLDWGLAKVLGQASPTPAPRAGADAEPIRVTSGALTTAGSVVGTPIFMAPEQASGEADAIGPALDVYGLGGILYILLTGITPRSGSTTEVCLKLAQGIPPPAPSMLVSSVPGSLERPCVQALASDPEQRPSAEELGDRMQAFLEGRSLGSGDEEDREFLERYSTREYRRPSVTVDVVLLASGGGAAAQVFLLKRAQPPFAGAWALPGTFVRLEETLEGAARRILREKCGQETVPGLEQLGAWGELRRDPRTRVITVAYLARVSREEAELLPDAGGEEGLWFSCRAGQGGVELSVPGLAERVALAFDHGEILRAALQSG